MPTITYNGMIFAVKTAIFLVEEFVARAVMANRKRGALRPDCFAVKNKNEVKRFQVLTGKFIRCLRAPMIIKFSFVSHFNCSLYSCQLLLNYY